MNYLSSFLTGLLFSLGLIISGMINPAKVLNFLDIFGTWDPSLAFVMGGAIVVTFFGNKIVLKRSKPLFESGFSIPTRSDVDMNLVGGAALFGIGWGLVGICPGPAIAAFAASPSRFIIFLAAMIVGMYANKLIQK